MKHRVPNALIRWAFVAAACLFFITAARPAAAYDPDTHLQVTYALCRAVGFTHDEAFTVAIYDQGMDDSDGTVANSGVIPHVTEEKLWHALDDGKASTAVSRRERLFEDACGRPDKDLKLIYLGVFFHYQQDTWAHRVHPNSSLIDFAPYSQPLGHAVMGHQPDRPPFDPECALRCLEQGIGYASKFLKTQLGRDPNPMFDGYTAASYQEDTGFSNRGKFIHQLAVDSTGRAHQFTTGLIRAQINAYTYGLELGNPNYAGYYNSNEAAYGDTRANLKAHCDAFGIGFDLAGVKPAAMATLTTDLLTSGSPPRYTVTIVKIQSVSNGQFIVASDGLKDNQWLYCKGGDAVEFELIGPLNNCTLRVKDRELWLSYNATTKAVKLWSTPDAASYSLEKLGNGNYAIKSLAVGWYIYNYKESPYVWQTNANDATAQWRITGLP